MKKIIFVIAALLVFTFSLAIFFNPFSAPSDKKTVEVFIVPREFGEAIVIEDLKEKGFIKSFWVMNFVLTLKGKHDKISSGAYYLSKNMNVFEVADKITGPPDLKWFSFAEGIRKEQIGERLKVTFNWSDEELDRWNNIYTAMKYDYVEGVYFPDTYLIPAEEDGLDIAKRMIINFNEKAGPYIEGFAQKDILWTTGVKIASLIQREAAGKDDMKLISGVIWNRLLKGQRLQIDATIQYAKGKVDDKWWSVVTPADIRNTDSLYNTYKHNGLPPHPIANPGLDAIEAALNPQETDCFYYLHDRLQNIHCSKTYEEHLENIEKYLN
ncbi:MAG: endolytic transglycosylase MltG [Candidatus Levybacteria bacterium]|nr:endolytic transglycosylase MltG [Candidatus Levybacteria bacterium]